MKLEIDIWFSADGLFCGTKEDYSSQEWEKLSEGYIFQRGEDTKEVYDFATRIGFCKEEIDELIGNYE